MRRDRGFTLIEVMAALAILAVGLAMLLRATSNTVRRAEKTRVMSAAIVLARGKMYDVEEALRKDGFQQMSDVGLPENEGDFEDEGWPQIHWKVEIREIELPSPEALAAMAEQQAQAEQEAATQAAAAQAQAAGLGSGAGSAAIPTESGGSSGLFGMLSMFGGMGGATAEDAAGASFISGFYTIIQDVFKQSLRKIVLTVSWRSIGVEDSFTVVEYLADPDAMNRVIGGAAGATADDYDSSTPPSNNNNNAPPPKNPRGK